LIGALSERKEFGMHPGALAAGVGALDVVIASQAVYALRRRDKDRSRPIERSRPPQHKD
jgi:hypothetical protein